MEIWSEKTNIQVTKGQIESWGEKMFENRFDGLEFQKTCENIDLQTERSVSVLKWKNKNKSIPKSISSQQREIKGKK